MDNVDYPSFICEADSVPHETDPGYSVTEGLAEAAAVTAIEEIPEWFQRFLDHRQASKPSAHTMKAYRRDFVAIANLFTGGEPARLSPADITRDSMRTAFAAFAADHEAASIRRCWSTWNVLCTFLYTNELLAAKQKQQIENKKLEMLAEYELKNKKDGTEDSNLIEITVHSTPYVGESFEESNQNSQELLGSSEQLLVIWIALVNINDLGTS